MVGHDIDCPMFPWMRGKRNVVEEQSGRACCLDAFWQPRRLGRAKMNAPRGMARTRGFSRPLQPEARPRQVGSCRVHRGDCNERQRDIRHSLHRVRLTSSPADVYPLYAIMKAVMLQARPSELL